VLDFTLYIYLFRENLFNVLFAETRNPDKVAQTEMAVYFVEDLFEALTIADFSTSIRPKRKA